MFYLGSKKVQLRSFIYILFVIFLILCVFIFIKSPPKNIIIQDDLLDYNDDGLRPVWSFKMNKHYDVNDLPSYKSKKKIVSELDLPGEKGRPVQLSPVLQTLADLSFSEYQLNIVASDKVSENRSLPDFRDPKCWDIKYPKRLPTTSVIIVIYNEAWSILMRAIWSVLNRTPDELLEEIILVDDYSDKQHLKEHLDEYLAKKLPSKVKLIRTDKREGLIRARVMGAENAKGQVLAFLDGNTESNDGWLEPLLSRIASDRSVIAIPHIDSINYVNMAYERFDEGLMYGIAWHLWYKTFPIPEREIERNHGDLTAPYRTPAMIGCAIIVDREFFFEIGTFDTDMNIWGGENTELSLRVWQCGGAMEIVPCSRMGHYFRTLPYSFDADKKEVTTRNNIRIANVWMDEYKSYYDVLIAPHLKEIDVGDLSKRIALRNKLQCKGFRWYLKHVFPESVMIGEYKAIGQIHAVDTKYCLDSLHLKQNKQIGIYTCNGNGLTQGFSYQKNQQIVLQSSRCLSLAEKTNITDPVTDSNQVVLLECGPNNGTKWFYDDRQNQIVHVESGTCLSRKEWKVIVAPCTPNNSTQMWTIETFEEYKRKLSLNL